jgi:ParB family chromosome partitioning protein
VLQPVLVRPAGPGRYELIAGERRWRAAKLAGLDAIPALVRESDDAASLELALVENMAREDLNPVEEARACAALVEELGVTREAVARRVGRNRVTISNLIRLLDLPDEALELLESGVLSEGHGRALLMAPDHGERRRLARDAAEHGWTVRELEARARGAAGRERPRRTTRRSIPPDQQEAMTRVAEGLGARLGCDVAVRPHAGGYRATVDFASLEEALEMAGAAGMPRPAPDARAPSGGPPTPR